jgi:hypothetical protein
MQGPGAYCRGGVIPRAAEGWPTLILTVQYSDGARLIVPGYARRYRPRAGAETWVAWTLTPAEWESGVEPLVEAARHYGAVGVVLNPEAGWENQTDERAAELVQAFRARGLSVAVCSYPLPRFHPSLPWRGWATADVGIAETYNRERNYPLGRVAACLAEWRAAGFAEVLSMVGQFAKTDTGTRTKTRAELRADLTERPAASSVVWGPPIWSVELSTELSRWAGAAAPPRPPSGGAVLLLLAAGLAAAYVARG